MATKKGWKKKLKEFIQHRGPGWITGASDDDPSGIGTYTVAGAQFGLNQLWAMLFTYPLMITVQEMSARIALVTGRGLAGVIRKHYSKRVLYICVFLLLAANAINIGANIGAMAAATRLLIPVPFALLALIFTVGTLLLEVFVEYKTYAKYLKWLSLSLFSYIIAGFLVQPDWGEVMANLTLPHIELTKEFFFVLTGVLGTTLSPYLYFWQASTEIEEEIVAGRATIKSRLGAKPKEIKVMRSDVKLGMFFSNFIAFFIIVTAAVTLHKNGIMVGTAEEAAAALAPIAGEFASLLFAVGIIGTGLLSIPVLAASASYAMSESFGWRAGLYKKFKDAHGFYGVITLAMLVGLATNFIGIPPIRLLLWSAVLNGVIAPVLLTLIIKIGNNTSIMGKWKNSPYSNTIGWTTVVVMSLSIFFLVVLAI